MLRHLRPFDEVLARVERSVGLIARARPLNAGPERARLLAALEAGGDLKTRFVYGGPPELDAARRALGAVMEHAPPLGVVGELYAERAAELDLEMGLVERLGRPEFRHLAVERYGVFRVTSDGASTDAAWAEGVAAEWARLDVEPSETIDSDDRSDPRSLIRRVQHEVGRRRLGVRVVVADLDAHAATGPGIVLVGRGRRHSVAAAERIAEHEVSAHAAPRVRAESEALGLFRVGSAGASEDEEGRALLIEERAGRLDPSRRRDLGWRHLAAATVRQGAEWAETARVLLGLGAGPADAVDVACRVHRGGGLAREIVYLPALARARRELASRPGLEGWLVRGRLSLSAARRLGEAKGEHPFVEHAASGNNCYRSGSAVV